MLLIFPVGCVKSTFRKLENLAVNRGRVLLNLASTVVDVGEMSTRIAVVSFC